MSENKPIPDGVKGWNWGAFLLTWIWGIGNQVWIALLALIPFFGLIFCFVLGFKGNEWAWKAGNHTDIQKFHSLQRIWGFVGLGLILAIVSLIVTVVILAMSILKSSEPYKAGFGKAQSSAKVKDLLGEPVKDDWYCLGEINYENASGKCDLEIPLSGPKGKATLEIEGTKDSSGWHYEKLSVEKDGQEIDLSE